MVTKPSNPKGTRDFSSEDLYRRNYLFGLMTEVFQRYGFQPIETPAMENLISLTGKYGEEGDQLSVQSFEQWRIFGQGSRRNFDV
jgi:histidyl-tRNA synthetase